MKPRTTIAAEFVCARIVDGGGLEIEAMSSDHVFIAADGSAIITVVVRVTAEQLAELERVDIEHDLETRKTIDLNPDAVVVDVPHEGEL